MKKNSLLDVYAWNALISAYALQGDWEASLKIFDAMKSNHILPDTVTFTYLLTATSHGGNCDKALELYRLIETFNIHPTMIHANLIVDALSRSGKHQQAADFIKVNIPSPNIYSNNTLIFFDLYNL